MSDVMTKTIKPKVAPKKVVKPKVTQESRAVPEPNRTAAPVVARQVLEHVYWLGWALKNKDKGAVEREFESLQILAKMYATLASSPSNRPIKYSSDVENYPPPKKKGKGLGNINNDRDDEETSDE